MFSRDEICNICRNFNIDCFDTGGLIDASRNDDDRRYNYKVNNQYFLEEQDFKKMSSEDISLKIICEF